MTRHGRKLSLVAKRCLALISVTVAVLGVAAIFTGYAPERFTRFGPAAPLYGRDAVGFGGVCLLVAPIPMLAFARNRRYANRRSQSTYAVSVR